MIAILTQDLMMSSSVSAVARAKGLEFKTANNTERLVTLLREHPVSTLFVDLQHPGLELSTLMASLKASCPVDLPKIIAYAQHVHVDLLSQARQAGIGNVLTRGQVHGGLETLINAC